MREVGDRDSKIKLEEIAAGAELFDPHKPELDLKPFEIAKIELLILSSIWNVETRPRFRTRKCGWPGFPNRN